MGLRDSWKHFRHGRIGARALAISVILAVSAGIVVITSPSRPTGLWSTGYTWPLAAHPEASDPVSRTGGLYVDPSNQPTAWVRDNPTDPRSAEIRRGIADLPIGRWFLGNWDESQVARKYTSDAQRIQRLPVLVLYNMPQRDCGGYSSGGAGDEGSYRSWIDGVVRGVGSRPALVIVEPDALAGISCLDQAGQERRLRLLSYVVNQFATRAPATWVYVDAGHSNWIDPPTMADRLIRAGVGEARGFALNVSNYQSTQVNVGYGQAVARELEEHGIQARFVIDTSRNGSGGNTTEWCNPPGQRVGQSPRLGGADGLDLQLWARPPGESDGQCGISPSAPPGAFVPSVAFTLLTGSDPPGWVFGLEAPSNLWHMLQSGQAPRPW